jgi:hypothetical protein
MIVPKKKKLVAPFRSIPLLAGSSIICASWMMVINVYTASRNLELQEK